MKRYSTYIKTGDQWCKEVPSDWETTSLKYVSKISKGRKAKEDFQDYVENAIPYLSMEYLRDQANYPVYVNSSDPSIVLVDENDILILWDGSKAGEIVNAKSGALSSTMAKIQATDPRVNQEYLRFYLKFCEPYFQGNTIGMGIPHVNGEVLSNLLIAVPSHTEQCQIIKYLKFQLHVIDNLISKKEQQIRLLKEKRQSRINEVVTKGIKVDVELIESGISWLGNIPKHWKVVKSKTVSELITDGAHISPDISSPDFPFISTVDLYRGRIDWDNCLRTSAENYEYLVRNGCKPEIGDVLYSKDGTIGKTTVIKEDKNFVVASSLIIARPNRSLIISEYLEYLLRSYIVTFQIDSVLSGVALKRVSLKKFSNLILVIPPIEEQKAILKEIDAEQTVFNKLLDMMRYQIECIRELRQSIIAEAVTGAIDLRDWQPVETKLEVI